MQIAIADDHPLIAEGFSETVLASYPSFKVFSVTHEKGLLALLKSQPIDLLFLDFSLKHLDTQHVIRKLRKAYPQMRIVIISSGDDIIAAETLFLQGADGYLLKSDPTSEVIRAIQSFRSGRDKFISTGIATESMGNRSNLTRPRIDLTPRELEILALILSEKTTKEISELLFISTKTVENHRANLLLKFGVKNVAGLVKKAILQGFLIS